jgi:hypothetical protein
MITRDEGDIGIDTVPPAEAGDASECATVLMVPGDRARTNLALLYGGTGRAPMPRVLIAPSDRLRAAAEATGGG